jgi:hypothetical protein
MSLNSSWSITVCMQKNMCTVLQHPLWGLIEASPSRFAGLRHPSHIYKSLHSMQEEEGHTPSTI